MNVATVLAPAKLTVSLAVTGVRADGYHELRAEMVSLNLTDRLTFMDGGSELNVVVPEAGTRSEALGPAEENLITRALRAVGRQATVHLEKHIPLGGGLGGGSTDAAAVLRWAGCTDLSLAAGLGADVPFCVLGGRALVEGIGERVTPLPFETQSFLLLLPPFGVNTPHVYAAWDALAPPLRVGAGNDLMAAALVVEPRLARWRDALGELTGLEPKLAGSGSTWFVEGSPPEVDREALSWLTLGAEKGRLVPAHAVPATWSGD
ncbi:MAG TPA: 4-(cytidine 5'-diphospho)-2-C-methyl-D-erythritol kinase [Acidimicrobiales bacterium]|nr:4-(cytidine 5'-diphospho)-2-C-methyl-D-erythritol kinase [Acidimicrobiales bacterium]